MKNICRQTGLSLLDLLAAISIGLSVLWISVPELSHIIKKRELHHSTQKIINLMEGAAIRSPLEGIRYRLEIGKNRAQLFRENETEPIETLLAEHPIVFIPKEHPILFHKTGSVTPARIGVLRREIFCEIVISLRGRIRRKCHPVA